MNLSTRSLLAAGLLAGASLPAADDALAPSVALDKFVVTAELPGMKKEDIDISMDGNTLCICGERKEEKEERQGTEVQRSERYYGRFQRNITLAQSVDPNKIDAKYKDGVLTINLPKTEESKRKQIPVKAS